MLTMGTVAMFYRIVDLSLAVFCGLIAALTVTNSLHAQQEPFEAFATELIETLERNAVAPPAPPNSAVQQNTPITGGIREISIAVWPFRAEEIPVSKSTADAWNEKLVGALVRNKPAYMKIVTRQHLKDLLREQQSIQAFEDVVNPTETLARNATVNFLIIGEVRATDRKIELAYKGVNVNTGELIASTKSRQFLPQTDGGERPLTLSAALSQAAKAFVDRGLDVQTLEIYGLREQPGKQVTIFSDYFASRLTAAF